MDGISRRQMLKGSCVAAAASLWGTACQTGTAPASNRSPKPNIVFILADDLGYGDLGCYGQAEIQTPVLDRFAAEGVRFTQCYAGSTVCAPSRCCLMTGLHTGHAHVRGNKLVPLRPEDTTVAETLRQAGYATGLVGKWGLGEPGTTGVPNRKGFDEFYGYLNQGHAHNSYPEYLWRNEVKEPIPQNVDDPAHKGVSQTRAVFSNDLFTKEALAFLDRHKNGPFFLYLSYTVPHANNERKAVEENGIEVPSDEPYAAKAWPAPQKSQAAAITRMDRDIGVLLDRLRSLGLDDNTIVFFTSDNGSHKEGGADPVFFKSCGPLRGFKRDLYEGGIRVPMLVRWPGRVAAGSVSAYPWAFWDFLPTATELARTEPPKGLDGISVLPALVGGAQPSHPPLYWEFHERGFDRATRMDNWKGVKRGAAPLELYDLNADIGETHDCAAQHPDLVSKFEAFLGSARTASSEWPAK